MAARSFKTDVQKFANLVGVDLSTVLRKVALDGLAGVLRRTPVDTGRLRASWRIGINQLDPTTAPVTEGPGSAATGDEASAQSAIASAKFGDTIHISNSVEYAEFVEDDAHMLADTFTELTTQITNVVKSVKR